MEKKTSMNDKVTNDQLVSMGLDIDNRRQHFEEGVLNILNSDDCDNETKAKVIALSHANWEADIIERIMSIFFSEKEVTHERTTYC